MYENIFDGVVVLSKMLKSVGLSSPKALSQIISLISQTIIGDQEFINKHDNGIVKYSNDRLYIRSLESDLSKIVNNT